MGRLIRLIAPFILLLSAALPAHAEKRVALVIGNDDYSQIPKLQKAVNDARAMGAALEGIGFTVLKAENLPRREMNRQLQLFASRLETGDEAVFFFAGHGVEIAGRNYLLPTDIPGAQPGQEDFVKAEAVAVDQVLETIRSRGTRVSILMLDACRDNPFPKAGTRSLGGGRGLARMPAPEGTFIMYSAGVGQTALDRLSDDDPNPNSVFTRSLIPLMQRSGLSLTQTARQVRRDVQTLAGTIAHDQRPAYYDEVTGDFFFAGRDPSATGPATPGQTAPVNPALQAWTVVQHSDSVDVLEEFLKQFPEGIYGELAKARLKELKLAALTPEAARPQPPDSAEKLPAPSPKASKVVLPDILANPPPFPIPKDVIRLPDEVKPPDIASAPEHACDRLAADMHDPQAVSLPTHTKEIRSDDAIHACTEAVLKYPGAPRFAFQLARAIQTGGAYDKAMEWFRKAAAAGSTAAMRHIANMLDDSYSSKDLDLAEAGRQLKAAASARDPQAFFDMGKLMRTLGRHEANGWFAAAMKLWREAAGKDDSGAMIGIAELYINGYGVEADPTEALAWYRRAAALGDKKAMYRLAGMLEYENAEEAAGWYAKSSEASYHALVELARYHDARGAAGRKQAQEAQKTYEARLTAAAQRGNAEAMVALGELYHHGQGIAKVDLKLSIDWYTRAANAGNVAAMQNLATLYVEDKYSQLRNFPEAARWLEKSAAAGHADAMVKLGRYYTNGGLKFERNLAKARHWMGQAIDRYKSLAEAGDVNASYQLRYIYQYYWPGPRDFSQAYEWVLRGAAHPGAVQWIRAQVPDVIVDGALTLKRPALARKIALEFIGDWEKQAGQNLLDASALENLGKIFETGDFSNTVKSVVKPDLDKSADYYERSARKGSATAMQALARLYHERKLLLHGGKPLSEWTNKWLDRLKAQAASGETWPSQTLAEAYRKGEVMRQDMVEATRWRGRHMEALERNASRGRAYDMNYLADAYASSDYGPPNAAKAIQWYVKSAEVGYAFAMYKLGTIYSEGKLVKADAAKAVKYHTMAADTGYASSFDRLIEIYDQGKGVPKNAAKAFSLTKQLSGIEKTYNLVRLGYRYRNGIGVSQSKSEAIRLYREAAAYGDEYAHAELAKAYVEGEGVKKDMTEAARWYRQGALSGDTISTLEYARLLDKGEGVTRDPAEAARVIVRLVGDYEGWASYFKTKEISTETRKEVERQLAELGYFKGTPGGPAEEYELALKSYGAAK